MDNSRLELYQSHKAFMIENNDKSRNRLKAFDKRASYFFKLRDKGILSETDFKAITKRLTGVEFDMKPLTDSLFSELEKGLTFKC